MLQVSHYKRPTLNSIIYDLLDTLNIQQESSLEEMQKQALYISQEVLRGLQEIGEGIAIRHTIIKLNMLCQYVHA